MTSSRPRVGVIGLGVMGRHHVRTVQQHAGCELAWVADHHQGRQHALAEQWQTAAGIGAADLVIVATPATAHESMCPQRGFTLVEKPLAATGVAARRLCRPGLWVGMSERFARRKLPADIEVRAIRRVSQNPRGRDVDVVADLLVHDLDRLYWSGRSIERFSVVRASWVGKQLESLVVQLPDARATLEVDRSSTPERSWHLGPYIEVPEPSNSDPLTEQLDALLRAMQGEDTKLATADDAIRVLDVCDRIRHRALSEAPR